MAVRPVVVPDREDHGMLPYRLIYHEGYDLNYGQHVFPSQKYRLIRERLLADGFACEEDFLTPEPASVEDLLLVHDPGWVERFISNTLTRHEIMRLEAPFSGRTADAFQLAADGTTLAARCALEEGVGFNIGGGFHHAFRGHGEGFCAINDLAVAVQRLRADGLIRRAMVVDCDVHHGNGTAAIFASEPDVFTLSIHQHNNYPAIKPPSTVDIHLPDGASDEEYVSRLTEPWNAALAGFSPDLVLYVAGADPFYQDQLGGLSLTMDGLRQRDQLILETALARGVPVAVTMAGGYALRIEDTVAIHCNTAYAAKAALEASAWNGRGVARR